MTNTNISDQMALDDKVRLVTAERDVPAGDTLYVLIQTPVDADYDWFVEVANGTSAGMGIFKVADNVQYSGGTPLVVSTSVIDGQVADADEFDALQDPTITARDVRYQLNIGGGSGSGNKSSTEARFTQALLKPDRTYVASVTNETGSTQSCCLNIRLWRINN